MKDLQIKNKDIKLSLSADNMIVHVENPMDSTNKQLE